MKKISRFRKRKTSKKKEDKFDKILRESVDIGNLLDEKIKEFSHKEQITRRKSRFRFR